MTGYGLCRGNRPGWMVVIYNDEAVIAYRNWRDWLSPPRAVVRARKRAEKAAAERVAS